MDLCQEVAEMGNYKKHPKYNVLSIRVTDEEKAVFDEMKRDTSKSISMLIREALQLYTPCKDVATNNC